MFERFCLNTATIKTTPLELQIDLARRAGFRQIGLWLKDVEEAMLKGASLAEIRAHLDSAGLRVAEFCFLKGWQDADAGQLKEVLHQTHHVCEVSRQLGCDIVVTIPAAGPGWLNGAPERFREVCRVAAGYDVKIALEFPGIAAEIKDLRSANDLICAADCPNGGLVIDTFHFFLGGSKLEDFEDVAPEKIFLVHVSDAMNLPMEKLRIPHDNRTFPGEGIIDFVPIFRQLDRLHYNGAISLEIWNRQLHQTDPVEVISKASEWLQKTDSIFRNNQIFVAEG